MTDYNKELSIIGLSNVLTSLAGMGLTGRLIVWVHVCCDQMMTIIAMMQRQHSHASHGPAWGPRDTASVVLYPLPRYVLNLIQMH